MAKQRLCIDFRDKEDLIGFFESIQYAVGENVALFMMDALDLKSVKKDNTYILKKKGDRPYGEMEIVEEDTVDLRPVRK